jgi:hypothetical protein
LAAAEKNGEACRGYLGHRLKTRGRAGDFCSGRLGAEGVKRPEQPKQSVFPEDRTMSKDTAFFKIRSTKRSNPEARTTLDSLHKVQLQKLMEKESDLNILLSDIKNINGEIKDTTDDIEHEKLVQRKRELEKDLESVTNKNEIYSYFLETGDILYNYYDIQDKIQRGAEGPTTRPTARAKPGSVLAALEEAAGAPAAVAGGSAVPPQGEMLRRDKLLEKYLLKVAPEHARASNELLSDPYGECPECEKEMIFSMNEALFTCTHCGHQEFVLIDSDKPSYKDPPREVSYYAYKRINHFNEWLAQFQAKESTQIPQEVYDALMVELKKERISDFRTLKPMKVREILRKLKYNKYYEHVPHIINRLNGQNAPVMTRETEEKLRFMFKEIQPSFQEHCPKGRSNFLSYSYVLYKFCELLELDEYLSCFPLLKNRDKLYVQDKIWEKICEDLRWQFIRSI